MKVTIDQTTMTTQVNVMRPPMQVLSLSKLSGSNRSRSLQIVSADMMPICRYADVYVEGVEDLQGVSSFLTYFKGEWL